MIIIDKTGWPFSYQHHADHYDMLPEATTIEGPITVVSSQQISFRSRSFDNDKWSCTIHGNTDHIGYGNTKAEALLNAATAYANELRQDPE